MDAVQFSFKTAAFMDPPEKLAENVNGFAGCALAEWMSGEVGKRGIDASKSWAEDHGWDFSARHGGTRYLIACIIQEDDDGAREGGVVVHKARSMTDKLFGRNRMENDDAVVAAVRMALNAEPSVRELTME